MIKIGKISIAALMSILLATSCSENKPTWAGRDETLSKPVNTMQVPKPQMSQALSFSGISKPLEEVILSFRVTGKIAELPIKEGMHLKEGDLAAKLDTSDYELDVQKMQAALIQANSQLETAQSTYARTRLLYEAANVSQSLLEQQLAAYNTAKAQLKTAQTAYKFSKKQLDYCTLKSPVDGDISIVLVSNFQAVSAGQPIAKMQTGGSLVFEVGLPEVLITHVNVNDKAQILFDAYPDKKLPAVVTEVGISISPASTYPVKLKLMEHDETLRAGMAGEAIFHFEEHDPKIVIPLSAVVSDPEGRHYVWIYRDKTQDVSKRYIEVDKLVSGGIELKAGLEPGETIIRNGANGLSEGMKVEKMKNENEQMND